MQSSSDMISWEDSGEVLFGDGSEIVVYDGMEEDAKSIYRVGRDEWGDAGPTVGNEWPRSDWDRTQ